MIKKIQIPISDENTIKKLKAGDLVYLTGIIYTARDAAHKRMFEEKKIPFDTKGAGIYYVGPTPAKKGQVIGSCGPTTSSRMDKFTPYVLSKGIRIMIGKGKRSDDIVNACKKYKAVYFAAPGGCGALLSKSVVSAECIAYPELLSEAVYKLHIKDFPAIVAIDAKGAGIY